MRKLSYEEIFSKRPDAETIEKEGRFPLYVIAENIRSLYNVGSIFRICDTGRVEGLFLCGYTGKPPRNEISKTALGAEKSVPWEYHRNTVEAVQKIKAQHIPVVLLEHTDESVSYTEFYYPSPLCLVVGNEVEGVSDEVVALADAAIEIPMHGIKQSLNVAIAFAVVLFHVIDVWGKSGTGEMAKFKR